MPHLNIMFALKAIAVALWCGGIHVRCRDSLYHAHMSHEDLCDAVRVNCHCEPSH
jgi:hypothetical protein